MPKYFQECRRISGYFNGIFQRIEGILSDSEILKDLQRFSSILRDFNGFKIFKGVSIISQDSKGF